MKYPRYDARRARFWFGFICLALGLLSCDVALALGLGEIRVISRPGEPLIAQIPIVSNALGELEQAHVGLADDDVFQRVGLDQPDALVRGLQFTFAKDAHDHALIWVTSQLPINQRALNFLIALEWPQGRLVREYTALVDTPTTVESNAAPPLIQGPDAVIARSHEQPSAAAQDSLLNGISGEVHAPPPISLPTPPDAATSVDSSPSVSPSATFPAAGANLVTVEKGQTLSEIAQDVADATDTSLNQAMLALLQQNPKSFIHGNVNALKQGAVLRAPSRKQLQQYSVAQARVLVRQQIVQWQQARAPIPQPAEGSHQVGAENQPPPPHTAVVAQHDRLEIATTASSDLHHNQAVTGTSASGEGDMQDAVQLQQAREDLASRQIEVQELRSRVDELERLKQKQDQLLQLKDSALAEANLQLSKKSSPQAAPTSQHWPLMWIVESAFVLLLAVMVAWLILRRARRFSPFQPTSAARLQPDPPPLNATDIDDHSDSEKLVGANQSGGMSKDWLAVTALKNGNGLAGRSPFALFKRSKPRQEDNHSSQAEDKKESVVPGWTASSSQWMTFAPKRRASADSPSSASAQHQRQQHPDSPVPVDSPPPPAVHALADARIGERAKASESNAIPSARERDADHAKVRDRLELARAYFELGDRTTAKVLLSEVMSSDDQKVRSEAIELSKQLS